MNDNRYAPPNAPVADAGPSVAEQDAAPAALQLATRLLWGSLAIGLVNTALEWTHLTSVASRNTVAGTLIFTFTLLAFLIYHIGRARNWARIVFLVMVILGGLPWVAQLPATFSRAPVSGSLSVLQSAIQLGALYIVFVTSARHSFRKRNPM